MSTKPHVQVTFISLILCFLCGQGLAQDGAMWGYRIAVDLSDCRALENGDSLVFYSFLSRQLLSIGLLSCPTILEHQLVSTERGTRF